MLKATLKKRRSTNQEESKESASSNQIKHEPLKGVSELKKTGRVQQRSLIVKLA